MKKLKRIFKEIFLGFEMAERLKVHHSIGKF
jgi:hypothetical protein